MSIVLEDSKEQVPPQNKAEGATVRYLLTHGADPNSVSRGESETALSAAIRYLHPEIIELLLEAGARPRFGAHDNDIELACGPQSGSDIDARKRVIQVLHARKVRMTADDFDRYQGPIYNDEQRACMKSFM